MFEDVLLPGKADADIPKNKVADRPHPTTVRLATLALVVSLIGSGVSSYWSYRAFTLNRNITTTSQRAYLTATDETARIDTTLNNGETVRVLRFSFKAYNGGNTPAENLVFKYRVYFNAPVSPADGEISIGLLGPKEALPLELTEKIVSGGL